MSEGSPAEVRAVLAEAHHSEWGTVFGTIVRLTGDWSLAEDCAQDAFAKALVSWERDGVPDNPGAWLVTAARNRAYDRLRRSANEREKLALLEMDVAGDPSPADLGDERLRLIFTCCHPALPLESRVALTLRAVGGLTTSEIARAFLVSESTVSQRILRAKQKIANTGIPYRVPPVGLRGERVTGVLGVIYMIFTEGYAPSDGSTVRDSLAEEAIRLARLVVAEEPADPEARGLLALLLIQHSRRRARVDADGDLVRLEDQDRSLWDRAMVAEGVALARSALSGGGPYALQAAIAAQHATAATAPETDWATIVHLYDRLSALRPNPIVELNRAVAIGMRDGPQATLDELERIGSDTTLAGNHAVEGVRGDALLRLGRHEEATGHLLTAIDLAPNAAIARQYRRLIESRS